MGLGLADVLRLGRVSNLPTIWSNALAAATLAGVALDPAGTALVFAGLSLFYVAGMVLNDYFDRAIDARERPERPIPSGRVAPATALGLGLLELGGGMALVAAAALRSGSLVAGIASGAALVLAIVLYDVQHKGNRVSPLVMGTCRGLVYTTAALALGGALSPRLLGGAVVLFAYVVALTTAARFENAGGGRIRKRIGLLIAGISVLDAGLIALASGGPARVAVAVGCFAATLALQRRVPGT